jgi:hypothetical protein
MTLREEFWWASFAKRDAEPVQVAFDGQRVVKLRRIGSEWDLDPVGVTLISQMEPAKAPAADATLSENLWQHSRLGQLGRPKG